jgi:hypothetical protein
MDRLETKKVWEEPKVVVHGDVERITQNKTFGAGDGFLLDQDGNVIGPIRNAS